MLSPRWVSSGYSGLLQHEDHTNMNIRANQNDFYFGVMLWKRIKSTHLQSAITQEVLKVDKGFLVH